MGEMQKTSPQDVLLLTIYSGTVAVVLVLIIIICLKKTKGKIKIKIQTTDFSTNTNENTNNRRSEDQIVINNKSDNNLVNEAKVDSLRNSSQSQTSRSIDSNEMTQQRTDLRLKINDSMIRIPNNQMESREENNDIYDVPPSRMSPQIVYTEVVVNSNPEPNGNVVSSAEGDTTHVYDSPVRR